MSTTADPIQPYTEKNSPFPALDAMDKLKSIFSRKKNKAKSTMGTKTETPASTETAPAVPAPATTAQKEGPSTSEPTPAAGAAPVEESKPADPTPSTEPAAPTTDPVSEEAPAGAEQKSEATAVAVS